VPSERQTTLTHTVAPGETVYHIAQHYHVSPERLMAANNLADPRELRAGEILLIPGHWIGVPAPSLQSGWFAPKAARQFSWPVISGALSSPFGIRNGVMHDGIDIDAPSGTPVRAADDGTVLFAGRLRGYGNVVILQHSAEYVTIYGHNERNLVRQNQRVVRGQEIAELGATGRASGPNLHFEVRYENHPQNPIAYLPDLSTSPGITFARNTTD
jgi:murein DD-endopeptidase MepM/ murein hydrolase activator NlpD